MGRIRAPGWHPCDSGKGTRGRQEGDGLRQCTEIQGEHFPVLGPCQHTPRADLAEKAMLASANASAAAPVAETAPIASSSTEPQASSSTAPQEETSTKAALAGESSKRPLEAMSPSDAAPEESSAKRARTGAFYSLATRVSHLLVSH